MSQTKFKVIGTRPIRHDGADKVTGRALYGADLYLAGMLVMAWNVYKTVASSKPAEALIPMPAHLAEAA